MKYLLDTHAVIWYLEDLTIITIDENIQKYDVSWIW